MFLNSVGGLSCDKVALVRDVCVCVHVQMQVGVCGLTTASRYKLIPSLPEDERLDRCR